MGGIEDAKKDDDNGSDGDTVNEENSHANANETAVERKLREVRERKKAALNKSGNDQDAAADTDDDENKIVVDLLDEFGKALKEANKTERAFITVFNWEPGHTAQGTM